MTSRIFLAAAAVAVLTLSACADDGDDTTATTPATTTTAEDGAPATTEEGDASEHSAADVRFARMMIPHHEQAIEMSDIILAKEGVPDDVRELAEEIKAAQGPEIEQLDEWLGEWGEPGMGRDDHGDHMGDAGEMRMMDGMLSPEEMQELADAEGTDAARLFLEQMIVHHEGAIDMAEDQVSGGTHPEAVELAQTIIDTQQREIDQMREMLAGL
ncbi:MULTISPECIES: DUF305 domain-containing protein [unclassified Dietzia]|uniref:DUF305 domain-containing protein n=1 Tax=unclassified Dietzia TaxID=2617939 RepID=UPI0015FCE794|nr:MULTISPECIES: DUF305 domain-containing protein [unclassified Dietzia]MBB1041248.1 DUF305 domain-containing protein [Dietzia sp. Cai40]MBB1043489.1 DUF305 domain-containing protein [Dietzia sp. DQ11-44]MBB1053470.1 DUF305 domain-containing protein [Dietzia sp. B44]